METSTLKRIFSTYSNDNQDVLSAFKLISRKTSNIRQGMSIEEISDVVSEKIINVVKEQFEATKAIFESKQNVNAEPQN